MAQPYNYSLGLPNPSTAINNALANAQGLQQLRHNKVLHQQQLEDRAAQQKAAAEQAKMQVMMQNEITALSSNPTADGITKLMVRYPQLADKYKNVHTALTEDEKQARIDQASRIYSALDGGSPSVAKKLLEHDIEAFRNSGREAEAKELTDMMKVIDLSPNSAKTMAGMFLSSAMGDKFSETFGELQENQRQNELQPIQVEQAKIENDKLQSDADKASADAQKAKTEAAFAKENILADLKEKKWKVTALQNEIGVKNQETRIKVIEAQIKKEGNAIKRQALEEKMKSAVTDRNNALRQKAAEVESAHLNIDNMVNTADRVINMFNEADKSKEGIKGLYNRVFGSFVDDATGPVDSFMPTVSQKVANFEELIGTLSSQAFLSQVPAMSGMGQLSDAEGKKLESALQNLRLRQSPEQLKTNILEAQRLLVKMRTNIANKYGVPESVPDTPDAEPSPDEVQNILKMYGVN